MRQNSVGSVAKLWIGVSALSERQITVIIKEPCRKARVEYLFDNSLEAFKRTVGGRIETVLLSSDIVFICNADGRNEGLPFNFNLCSVEFYGPVVIVGAKRDKFASINMRLLDGLLCHLGL